MAGSLFRYGVCILGVDEAPIPLVSLLNVIYDGKGPDGVEHTQMLIISLVKIFCNKVCIS
jgi:hypothetical protein